MTQDHAPEFDEGAEDPTPESTGSEASASDPSPQSEDPSSAEETELTVDDILNEFQTDEAKSADAEADASEDPAEAALADEANPYLDDLRRLTAEYANFRKRTETNREVERQRATARAVEPLLGVLDDLDRAEEHGDLVEGSAFLAIAQKIRTTLEKLGLESFGTKGEPFDPTHHEAIAQVPVPGTEEHTVLDVIELGYRIGEVELRPAKVAVAVSADG